MNKPVWDRTYETFILIPGDYSPGKKEVGWNTYMDFFKKTVAPTIWTVYDRGMIDWFSFLVHDQESGVPLQIKGIYIHLRFSLTTSYSIEEVTDCFPTHFQGTRQMDTPDTLDAVEVNLLSDYDEGWRLMGESSMWVMNFIRIHGDKFVPPIHARQFLHYLENMLLIDILREDEKKRKCKRLGWLYTRCYNLLQRIEEKARK